MKELKKQQAELENKLVELMDSEGEQSFKSDNGQTVTRRDKLFVSVRNEDKPLWFNWVRDIGRSDLIKTDVNKVSINALVRKIVKGEEDHPMPEFLDMQSDIFFKHAVEIKLGKKSLRRAAADAGADTGNQGEF